VLNSFTAPFFEDPEVIYLMQPEEPQEMKLKR
jgi:hypothetical protein